MSCENLGGVPVEYRKKIVDAQGRVYDKHITDQFLMLDTENNVIFFMSDKNMFIVGDRFEISRFERGQVLDKNGISVCVDYESHRRVFSDDEVQHSIELFLNRSLEENKGIISVILTFKGVNYGEDHSDAVNKINKMMESLGVSLDVEVSENSNTNSPTSVCHLEEGAGDCPSNWPSTSSGHRENAPSPELRSAVDENEEDLFGEEVIEAIVTENRRLLNIGNSCFMNSALQALSTCEAFWKCGTELAELKQRKKIFMNDFDFALCDDISYLLNRLSRRFYDSEARRQDVACYYLRQIKRRDLEDFLYNFKMLNNEFLSYGQKDVHEFLMVLLGFLDDIVTKAAKRTERRVENPTDLFTSTMETCWKCKTCGNEEFRKESRIDLTMHLRPRTDIETLLSEVFAWSEVEKTCESETCKNTLSTWWQGNRLVKFPEHLIVTLPRYTHSGSIEKDTSRVEPNTEIDVEMLAEFSPFFPDDLNAAAEVGGNKPKMIYHPLSTVDEVQAYLDDFDIKYNEVDVERHLSQFAAPRDELTGTMSTTVFPISNENCSLYRSIAYYLMGDESQYESIEESALEMIRDHREQLLRYAGKIGSSSMGIEVMAVATVLNVDIYVLSDAKWCRFAPLGCVEPNFAKRQGSIYLMEKEGVFQPIAANGSTDKANLERKRKASESEAISAKKAKRKPNYKYTLTAAVCHIGDTPTSGHYVAYTKDKVDGWFYCSDEHVRPVTEQEMCKGVRNNGYVFFYSKFIE